MKLVQCRKQFPKLLKNAKSWSPSKIKQRNSKQIKIIRQFLQLYKKETLSARNVNLSCHHVINKSTDNNKFTRSYNIRLSVFKETNKYPEVIQSFILYKLQVELSG